MLAVLNRCWLPFWGLFIPIRLILTKIRKNLEISVPYRFRQSYARIFKAVPIISGGAKWHF